MSSACAAIEVAWRCHEALTWARMAVAARVRWHAVARGCDAAPLRLLQGNYSDLLVQLSAVYSQLRGDVSGTKNEDSAQGFVRSTTKYWVRMTDVSAVKHHILQHLPVFQYNQGSVRACVLLPRMHKALHHHMTTVAAVQASAPC